MKQNSQKSTLIKLIPQIQPKHNQYALDDRKTTKKSINQINQQLPQNVQQIKQIKQSKQTIKQKMIMKLSKVQENIYTNIINGVLQIKQQSNNLCLRQPPKQLKQQAITLKDKISQLNEQLKQLRQSIIAQKEYQKQYHQQKQKQAAQLIERLRRQKYQYKKKNKFQAVQKFMKNRAYSQSLVQLMHSETQKKLKKKKQQIAGRVQAINKRKDQRQQQNQNKQSQYWNLIKSLSDKRAQSQKILPKINNSPINLIRKKKKVDWSSIKQHHIHYQQKINKFALYSKQNPQEPNLEKTPRKKSKPERIQEGNDMFVESLKIGRSQSSPKYHYKRDSNHILVLADNKYKQFGNQYLKESLEKINKSRLSKQELAEKIEKSKDSQEINVQQTIQLKANYIPLAKNQKIQDLQQKWQKILKEMKNKVVERGKGLQLLMIIQKKLDKIDSKGIPQRLRQKLQLLNDQDNLDDTKTVIHQKF